MRIKPTWGLAAAVMIGVLLLQALIALRVHQGNPLGLFLVGDQIDRDGADWSVEVPVRNDSVGYDGQFFLILALDPLLRTTLREGLDDVSYRAHRISWSGAAFIVSAGNPAIAITMLFVLQAGLVGVTSMIFTRRLAEAGRAPSSLFVLLFSLGSIACLSRMVGDLVMVCLLVLALHCSHMPGVRSGALATLLMALCILQKETAGLALPVFALWDRSQRWVVQVARFGTPLFAVAGWWLYVRTRAPLTEAKVAGINLDLPLRGWIETCVRIWSSDRSDLVKMKELALLGVFGALVMAGLWRGGRAVLSWFRSLPFGVFDLSLFGFSSLAVFLSQAVWVEVWAYSRALLPVVVLLLWSEGGTLPRRAPSASWSDRPVQALLWIQGLAGLVFLLKNLATGTA